MKDRDWLCLNVPDIGLPKVLLSSHQKIFISYATVYLKFLLIYLSCQALSQIICLLFLRQLHYPFI